MNKNYIYSKQKSLFGHSDIIGFGEDSFFIKEIERNIANNIIIKNHYSHKFYNATYIHLGIFINNELLGVLQFGYAMNPASQEKVVANTKINEYLELNRMWLDDKAVRNSESKAISYAIKFIKKKFPKIKWIQSFADERCGCFGIVYQASDFKYYGEHTSLFWYLDDEVYHNILMTAKRGKQGSAGIYLQENKHRAESKKLRQFRYIYYIDRRCIKDCLLQEKPFEKHYNQVV